MKNLRTLKLSGNQLTGTIPSGSYAQMLALENLDVSHNLLTGNVPSGILLAPSLKFVDVRGNDLEHLDAGLDGEQGQGAFLVFTCKGNPKIPRSEPCHSTD